MGTNDAVTKMHVSRWLPAHTRVYVMSLPPDELLAHVKNHVCMGGFIPSLKRLVSDLPLAGREWGDGFAVRLNRPQQFSVSAAMDWDGVNSTIRLTMRSHSWAMPTFGLTTSLLLFFYFAEIDSLFRAAIVGFGWFSLAMAFAIIHWRNGQRVMTMTGDVLEQVSKESMAKFWRVR